MASQSYPPLHPPKVSVMNTLKEMFPNVDSCVIEMVVDQFKELDPSINSLLEMVPEMEGPSSFQQQMIEPKPQPSPFKKAVTKILQPEDEGIDMATSISRLSPEAPEFIPNAFSNSYVEAAARSGSRPAKFETYQVPPRMRPKPHPNLQSSSEDGLPEGVLSDLDAGVLVMVVLRGLPGSGKSRLARRLLAAAGMGVLLSTDDYFLRNGKYEWKMEDLPKAHTFNQNRSKREVDQQTRLIIIDNTNLVSWEFRPYVAMAASNGYRVFLVEPTTPWKFKPSELAKKNTHAVPIKKIRMMLDKFEKGLVVEDLLKRWNLPLDHQIRLSVEIAPIAPPQVEPIDQSVATEDVLNDEDIFESESEDELVYNEEEVIDVKYSMENLSIDVNEALTVGSGESFSSGLAQLSENYDEPSSNLNLSNESNSNFVLSNLRTDNDKPPIWDPINPSDSHSTDWGFQFQGGIDLRANTEDPSLLQPKPAQPNLPGIKPINLLSSPSLSASSDVFLPNSESFGLKHSQSFINSSDGLLAASAFSDSKSTSPRIAGAFSDGQSTSPALFGIAFSDSKSAGSAFSDSKSTSQQEEAVGWEAFDKATVSWEPVGQPEIPLEPLEPLEPRDKRRGRSSRDLPPPSPSISTASTASSTSSRKTESSLESLLTMFPNVPVCELENIHKEHRGDNSKVINFLLDKGESSNSHSQQDALLNQQPLSADKGFTATGDGGVGVTTVSMQLDPMFAVTLQEMFGPPLDQPFLEMLSPDEILSLPMPVNVAMQVFLAWRNALQNMLRSKPDIPSPPEANSPVTHPPPPLPGFPAFQPPPRSPSQSRFPVPRDTSSPKTVLAPNARQFYEQQQLNRAMAASLAPPKKVTRIVDQVEQSQEEALTQEQLDDYRKQRNELYRKAQDAHSRKAGGTAGFYAQQAREMNEQIKTSQREMQMNWFINSNQDKSDNRLDLHYLPVKDAIENLKEFIGQQQAVANKNVSKNGRNGTKTVEVITGKGNRNEVGKSKLKPAVINWLIQKSYKYSEINPGSLKVYLKKS